MTRDAKSLNVHERDFIGQVASIRKLVHVNPATSSTGEMSGKPGFALKCIKHVLLIFHPKHSQDKTGWHLPGTGCQCFSIA